MRLYDLTHNYSEVLNLLEEGGLEPSVLADTLDSIREPMQQKAENTVKVIQHLENNDLILKKEIDRLQEKRKANQKNVENLKHYLRDSLDMLPEPKVKTALFNIWVQNNPPSLVVHSEKYIPKDYFIEQAPQLDRRKLLNAIKGGDHVEGVELTQSRGVRIR